MKLKRLLAGFIAVAMTAAMIPAMVFADESENAAEETTAVETTEAKEEEKKPEEKPAESEDKKAEESKAEEPAETEDKKAEEPAESKETEPAETEDKQPAESEDKTEPEQPAETAPEAEAEQPDTVTGKTPGESDSSDPKKAPIEVETITDIGWDGAGSLRWSQVPGATQYFVKINTIEEWTEYSGLFNTYTIINNAIRTGCLKKPSDLKFTFTVFAYDDDYTLLGKGVLEYNIPANLITADEPAVKAIPGAKIKSGRLYWNKLKNAIVSEYSVRINGTWVNWYTSCPKKGVNLKPYVNRLIKDGKIDKAKNNKYSILLLAYDGDNVVGRYSATLTYKTSAKRVQQYTFDSVTQDGGRLNWSAIKGAKKYVIDIWDPHGGDDDIVRTVKTTSADINNIVANDMLFEDAPGTLDYALTAYNSSGDSIAFYRGTFNFSMQPNPLSVSGKTAKVKYSKLKKKKQTLAASKVINGTGTGRGPMTYTKVSGNKNITINKTTGKVTIKKKGLKKGKTYSVTVVISAAGNGGYEPSTEQTVTFKIKVTK